MLTGASAKNLILGDIIARYFKNSSEHSRKRKNMKLNTIRIETRHKHIITMMVL